jgi:hypothetical protein
LFQIIIAIFWVGGRKNFLLHLLIHLVSKEVHIVSKSESNKNYLLTQNEVCDFDEEKSKSWIVDVLAQILKQSFKRSLIATSQRSLQTISPEMEHLCKIISD